MKWHGRNHQRQQEREHECKPGDGSLDEQMKHAPDEAGVRQQLWGAVKR